MRLLRGRVLIRPIFETRTHGGIIVPDDAVDKRTNQNTLGRGVVVMMGPPALDEYGNECPPGFAVGDEVLHVGQHVSREVIWGGEKLRACSQEEVQAVIEPEAQAADREGQEVLSPLV